MVSYSNTAMILTFKQLSIEASDYNGMCYAKAHALIANIAIDYILACNVNSLQRGTMDDIEHASIGDIGKAFTNFITGTVYVPTVWDRAPCNVSMDGWTPQHGNKGWHTLH